MNNTSQNCISEMSYDITSPSLGVLTPMFGVFTTDFNQKQLIITLKYTNRTLTVRV